MRVFDFFRLLNSLTKACFLMAFVGLLISCKRDRIVDSSTKQRPVWVYGIEPNAIIVEAQGRTHDEAREKAFTEIKESIVNSVAVNVSSTVQMEISEQVMNDVRLFREKMKVNTTVSSAFLSTLRGVHINKASDWYWELRRTPDKERYVVYHVKYPFTEKELSAYINEWEALDAELYQELHSIQTQAESTRNLNELANLKTEAERLASIFKEPRRSLAQNTATRIRQKLNNVQIEVVEHQRGELLVALRSGGDRFQSSAPLMAESACAEITEQQYIESEGAMLIHYDVTFCTDPGQNIDISLLVDGHKLSKSIAIPDDPDHVNLSISGPLQLRRIQGHVHEWQLPLRLLSDESVEVVEIEVSLERISGKLLAALSRKGRAGLFTHISQPIHKVIDGRGDHKLIFTATRYTNEADDIFTSLFDNSATYSASGRIYFRKKDAEAVRAYRFENAGVILR